ncbi:MAG TPA: hypothetical protein VE955_05575 [Candidatus Dormibacteraeota bacterium]|nr:hypothetical protein [Candidatus Dormibacteraeota bacterium]
MEKNRRIAGRDKVLIILALVTLVSASVAAVYSSNYYQFYPALEQLQVSNPAMFFAPTNNSLNGYAIFTVTNPTSYNGLAMSQFEPSFEVYAPNGTLIPAGSLISFIPPRDALTPNTVLRYNITFSGSGSGVYQVWQMVNTGSNPDSFSFNFTIAIYVSTFIQTFASVHAVYVCGTHIGGGSCLQAAVVLNSTPTPSAGGGGL